ncbi:MAG: two-component system response regulator [Clostridiales bacterium 38-18]|nr:MAG: two-component system response regulator [Clostridiales bacterium 38-18]
MKTILIADDEKNMRWILKNALSTSGFKVIEAEDGEDALDKYKTEYPDLVLLDLKMPKIQGIQVLQTMIEIREDIPIIIISAHGTMKNAIDAMKLGAFDFISKPFDLEALKLQILRALKMNGLSQEISDFKKTLMDIGNTGIIGTNPIMVQIYEIIEKVAKTEAVVLITGETGTGKEVIGNAIFSKSNRFNQPFVKVNCGAIPETLIESELFGHEKGAFTGAISRKPGKFERAENGTIFLDEIGELPMDIQVKLLRVIQNREYERVGGTETLKCDIRIIASTNRDLKKMVDEGSFREDLYYRLNVIPIHVPPLRARKTDIPLLGQYFIQKICGEMNREVPDVEDEVWTCLIDYQWPGNIRELQNIVERILILHDSSIIKVKDLPLEIRNYQLKNSEIQLPSEGINMDEVIKSFIVQALDRSDGNRTKAAELLGITRHTLLYRMDKYKIE